MNAKKNKALAVAVIGLATLALTAIGLAQKQPLHHVVTFAAFCDKDLSPSGEPGQESQNDPNWYGVVTITIDGQKYEGTAAWQTVKGNMYADSFYGCAKATYDFGDLGMVEIWERCKTTFDDVTETHRKHGYSGIEMIADGTGAFEKAMGVFYFTGHTEFWAEAGVPIRGEAVYAGSGMIDGIKLPEQ
jgi:hypothetical protein